jgi:hypothetical protein
MIHATLLLFVSVTLHQFVIIITMIVATTSHHNQSSPPFDHTTFHADWSMDIVKLVIEATRIANGISLIIPTP